MEKNILLSSREIETIVAAFRTFFAPEDHIWLFGSRTNSEARGGDIDLYIETTLIDPVLLVEKNIQFICDLQKGLGEQKIDLILHRLGHSPLLPIYAMARAGGVLLA